MAASDLLNRLPTIWCTLQHFTGRQCKPTFNGAYDDLPCRPERVFFASLSVRPTGIALQLLLLVGKWDGLTKSDAESATVVRPRFMALDMDIGGYKKWRLTPLRPQQGVVHESRIL